MSEPAAVPADGPHVLVVDDERDLRDPLRDWLTRAGYPTATAANGREALAVAARQRVDIVVTDFAMPELDGLQLLDHLKALHPDIQVIFLTGHATKELAIAALRHGRAYDMLEKPLHNARRLATLIDAAWATRRGAEPIGADDQALPEVVQDAMAKSPAIRSVFNYILPNLTAPLALGTVAAAVGYHPAYLTDLVRRETGQPLVRWIGELRMRKAQTLLRETRDSVGEIALAVGYPDRSHFARLFRQHTGEAPQAWRELHAEPRDPGVR